MTEDLKFKIRVHAISSLRNQKKSKKSIYIFFYNYFKFKFERNYNILKPK